MAFVNLTLSFRFFNFFNLVINKVFNSIIQKHILEIDGKRYEFPVVEGSENEQAIDIKKLRDLLG
jgi:hypothetical protein